MKLQINDKCIFLLDDWVGIENQKVVTIGNEIEIEPMLTIPGDTSQRRTIKPADAPLLRLSPYSIRCRSDYRNYWQLGLVVQDLTSSFLRNSRRLEISDIYSQLKLDNRLNKISDELFATCLKSCVAAEGIFTVEKVNRKGRSLVYLQLAPEQLEYERLRSFAGSVACELIQISERIKLLISHKPTVGTYRENLLQTLLRKHLPERYHVATGFIFGCPRQIDVLIYDRIDYAPILREGDLVVVPKEAVRAVIEVKTTLTPVELNSSLSLLDEVSRCDDNELPFFKGIFAFGSPNKSDTLLDTVVDFYGEPTESVDIENFDPHIIFKPFEHLTCLCVLAKVYAEIRYNEIEEKRLVPHLHEYESATGLEAQASYFLELLLAYLRPPSLKRMRGSGMSRLLGADTTFKVFKPLTTKSWGAYFVEDEGIPGNTGDEVKEMEEYIRKVKKWLSGEVI